MPGSRRCHGKRRPCSRRREESAPEIQDDGKRVGERGGGRRGGNKEEGGERDGGDVRSARARMEGGVGRRMEGERDGGDVWSARARMEGGVGRRMEGAGKAIGGDCGRMAASAMGGADIAYRFDPMASVDGGDPRQNRAPKASVNVYISFLCSSRDLGSSRKRNAL
jgi:hypothetical protein